MGDLYLTAPGRGTGRRLTDLPGAELEAAWAPDGRRVAFTHLPPAAGLGEVSLLATVGVEDGRVATLTAAPMRASNPAWSPDGARIAFHFQDDRFTWGLAVVNADGTGLTRLAGARHAHSGTTAWSADGTRLVFTRFGTDAGLWAVDVRDGRATALDPAPSCGAVPRPSPDGRLIAFTAVCAGDTRARLYVANADGSGRRRLAEPYPFSGAAWAPDGRRVVFDAQGVDEPGDVFVISVDGGAPEAAAAARGAAELWPDWRRASP